jgi:hypothetical protein
MVDEVLADGVVTVHGEGDLELGADAIDAGNEDGLLVFAVSSANRPPKPPTLPSTSRR